MNENHEPWTVRPQTFTEKSENDRRLRQNNHDN